MTTTSLQVNNDKKDMVTHEPDAINREIIEKLVLEGDLSKMSQKQKVDYYVGFCQRLGMDPATKPFMLLKLNGKESLYCDRSGAAQLNKIYNISHTCVGREKIGDSYVVTMRASDKNHYTESTGVVYIGSLKGDALSNAMMKAETKAKRRSTLDLVGLGILDESEIGSIKGATIKSIDEDISDNNIISIKESKESVSHKIPVGNSVTNDPILFEAMSKDIDGVIEKISRCSTLECLKETFGVAYKSNLKNHPRFSEIEKKKDEIKEFILDAQKKLNDKMNSEDVQQ